MSFLRDTAGSVQVLMVQKSQPRLSVRNEADQPIATESLFIHFQKKCLAWIVRAIFLHPIQAQVRKQRDQSVPTQWDKKKMRSSKVTVKILEIFSDQAIWWWSPFERWVTGVRRGENCQSGLGREEEQKGQRCREMKEKEREKKQWGKGITLCQSEAVQ